MAGTASAAELATGNPKVQSVESITFGPDGLLIIGDGKGSQVIAVHTGDVKPETWGKLDGKDINEQIGGMLGTNAKGVQIIKLAVNPASKKVYLAVKKISDKQTLILTVDGQGKIKEFSLDNVKYNRYKLPNDDNAKMMINDLTFADGRIILAAKAGQQFVAKIYTIDTRQDDATPILDQHRNVPRRPQQMGNQRPHPDRHPLCRKRQEISRGRLHLHADRQIFAR